MELGFRPAPAAASTHAAGYETEQDDDDDGAEDRGDDREPFDCERRKGDDVKDVHHQPGAHKAGHSSPDPTERQGAVNHALSDQAAYRADNEQDDEMQ